MTLVSQLLMLVVLTSFSGFAPRPVAQECKVAHDFQGQWQWAVYAKSKEELPLALQDMELNEVPRYSLVLDIDQKGDDLIGRYGSTAQFLAKVEDGSFTTTVKNKVGRLSLESAFGGKVTVKITLKGAKLRWKLIMVEGEHYFPDEVVLERRQVASAGLAGSYSSSR